MSQRAFLYNLQLIDSQIDLILDRISNIENSINSNKEIIESQKLLDNIIARINAKKNEINEIETQANKLSLKFKQNNDALYTGKIKNPKQLQSVEEENVSLKKRIQIHEDALFELMLENEAFEKELSNQSSVHENLLIRKQKENSDLLLQKNANLESLEKLKTEKSPIEKQIKSELLQKYSTLRDTKKKLAVATVSENACTACGNMITPAEIQKVKSAVDEYYCQICKRILYHG